MATRNTTRASSSKSRSAKSSAAPKRNIPVLGIVFVGIALIVVAAVVFTGGSSDTPEQTAPVEVVGDPLDLYPQGVASPTDDPAVGSEIPTLNGVNLDGGDMTISADGTPKGIAFLAHWCSHCQEEVPRVTEWVETTGGVDGVELVAVTTSIDSVRDNYPPDEWLREEGWPAETMRDDENGSAHLAYGGGGFPYWVFVNADGEVVGRTAGQLDSATLEAFLTLAREG